FEGLDGPGKTAVARALADELLAVGAPNPDDARRRALADPSPHPDLVWLAPPGTQHLVDELRRRVITAAAYRPFEGERRVFVIEAAEAMADESQNALLKTLEEPADFVHLVLVTSEPELLLETVRSRCQPVRFAPLDVEALESRLEALHAGGSAEERRAAARLGGGGADGAARRAGRRARTEALDLGLALVAAWLRDLSAVGEGAEDLALNVDEIAGIRSAADGLDPRRARRAAELVIDTRRRLRVNVGEELALEALVFRLQSLLRGA